MARVLTNCPTSRMREAAAACGHLQCGGGHNRPEAHVCTPPTSCCHSLQGKRHQQNLAKRAAWEAQDKPTAPAPQKRAPVSKTVKIGRPGYRVTKQFDTDSKQRSLLFQVGSLCRLHVFPRCHPISIALKLHWIQRHWVP